MTDWIGSLAGRSLVGPVGAMFSGIHAAGTLHLATEFHQWMSEPNPTVAGGIIEVPAACG